MQHLLGKGWLKRAIVSCGLDRESLEWVRVTMSQRNLRILTFTSGILCVFGALLFSISLASPVGRPYLYAFLVASGLLLRVLKRFVEPRNTLRSIVLSYAVMLVTLIYAIGLSFIPSHFDEPAVSLVAFLVLMPLTVLDVAWHMYVFMGVSAATYLWLSIALKPARSAMYDCVNVVTFLLLGMVLYTIISNECVRELNDRRRVEKMQQHLIVSIASVVEARDEDTGGHIKRTGDYVAGTVEHIRRMPEFSGMSDAYWSNVIHAAPLHDIGKLRVPDTILNKPGRLTNEEFETIKMHPAWGAEIVERTFEGMGEDAFLEVARNVALYHHERWDGNGYPTGASGPDIPLEARIMAIADVYDALISERAYKPPFTKERARRIIADESGTHFDPMLVDAFFAHLSDDENESTQPARKRGWWSRFLDELAHETKGVGRAKDEKQGWEPPRLLTIDMVLGFLGTVCTIAGVVALVALFRVRANSAVARDQYDECVAATTQLMEASDYLTTESRLYVIRGDVADMNAYVEEETVTRRRDNAVDVLRGNAYDLEAAQELEEALSDSRELSNREHYAMKLMAEATGASMPDEVSQVDIDDEDARLDEESKRALAEKMLFDDDYEQKKSEIREDVRLCGDDLARELLIKREMLAGSERRLQTIVFVALVLDAVLVVVGGIVNYLLVMVPMRSHGRNLSNNEPLSVQGSRELRDVAESYNYLYRENMRRTSLLKRQAKTDALTGLLNRGSFDRALARDDEDVALIMIDVDQFKGLNDRYGHETGDRVLCKVATSIKNRFRTTDYVCRIGGDEFAVIVTEIKGEMHKMLSDKLDAMFEDVSDTSDGLPEFTISAGIAFGATTAGVTDLYRAADSALYVAKRQGRNGYTFFEPPANAKANQGEGAVPPESNV